MGLVNGSAGHSGQLILWHSFNPDTHCTNIATV